MIDYFTIVIIFGILTLILDILLKIVLKKRVLLKQFFLFDGVVYYLYKIIIICLHKNIILLNIATITIRTRFIFFGIYFLTGMACIIGIKLLQRSFVEKIKIKTIKRVTHKSMWIMDFFLFLFFLCLFIESYFGRIGIDTILFQITVPLDGANEIAKYILGFFIQVVLPVIYTDCFIFHVVFCVEYRIIKKQSIKYGIIICIALFCLVIFESNMKIILFLYSRNHKTDFYEKNYVFPNKLNANKTTRNLILIYMESMESSYADQASGGCLDYNLIPNLTELANDNISFSNTDKLGGFDETYGANITVGALFASSSGIPMSMSIDANNMNKFSEFYPKLTNLGDILYSYGYNNVFICGSDMKFSGREKLYSQHGNYEILDYYAAIKNKDITNDYYVWWGHEDKILYERAKDKLNTLYNEGKKFNVTLLTADTHFEDGYVCDLCPRKYKDQYANVIACADQQVYEFVQWCKKQPFYNNTTIVIIGDHKTMDTDFMEKVKSGRKVYNCIINSGIDKKTIQTKNRQFTTVDLFPTILSALGISSEENRLGLGTDLFSDKKTLVETIGKECFDKELAGYSDFYLQFFEGK